MKKLIILTVFLLLLAVSGFAKTEPLKHIRSVVTREEFLRSGLNKLTEEELNELSGILYGWNETTEIAPVSSTPKVSIEQESAFGDESIPVEKDKSTPPDASSIRSRIKGDFSGWKGGTRFQLENGQVWKQTDKKSFYLKRENPEVEIRKGLFNAYYLSVVGFGSECKVKRVK
jgi:hypothetical protein